MEGLKRYFPLISAVLFAGLVLAAVLVLRNEPGTNSTPAQIWSYAQTHQKDFGKSSFFLCWGIIAGFAFYGCVFSRFRDASPVLALTGFIGAAVFATSGAISAGTHLALNDTSNGRINISPVGAQVFNFIDQDLTYAVIIVGLTVFYLATAIAILKTKPIPIPRVWGWVTVVFGLVSITGFFTFFAFLASPVWVVVMGALLVVQNRRDQASAAPPIQPVNSYQ